VRERAEREAEREREGVVACLARKTERDGKAEEGEAVRKREVVLEREAKREAE
jgi:hypothetical protein